MKNKLVFLFYLLPSVLIVVFFTLNNTVLISVTSNVEGIKYEYEKNSYVCNVKSCEIQVPRSLRRLKYSKEGFADDFIAINTYKNTNYKIDLIKVTSYKKVDSSLASFTQPFVAESKNDKIILYSNQKKLIPLASFPGLSSVPQLIYSSNLRFVLLLSEDFKQKYLFDLNTGSKFDLSQIIKGQDFKVLNDGDILQVSNQGLIQSVNRFGVISQTYNIDSLEYIHQIQSGTILLITQNISNVFTSPEIVDFAISASEILLLGVEPEPYGLYALKKTELPKEILKFTDLNTPSRIITLPKVNNKIYLESPDGLFEIEL